MKTIWFDITNTPQVHFLTAIYEGLKGRAGQYEYLFTTRDFSETVKILEQKIDLPFRAIGGHQGKNLVLKGTGLISRFSRILLSRIDYDISLSCGSDGAIWSSFIRRKFSIAFGDNDLARQWTYSRFVDFAFFPDAIPAEILTKQGLNQRKLFLYPGYKEDIYLAGFEPDPEFLNKLPFSNYVVVRPENIKANYIAKGSNRTITPEILKKLSEKGFNILYLPRYQSDKEYGQGIKNVFMPDEPLNGLDVCYYANAVLTGAGTFAREAACLGVPSFSFFAGQKLLAVDQQMIKNGMMFFSRNPSELVTKVLLSKKEIPDLNRSIEVKKVFMDKLAGVLNYGK